MITDEMIEAGCKARHGRSWKRVSEKPDMHAWATSHRAEMRAILEAALSAAPVGEGRRSDVKFEQLLSYRSLRGACIRDLIFEHYEALSTENADRLTKEFIESLHEKFWKSAPVAQEPVADDLRALGWTVAVHNDYRLNGEPYTFWLFTKGDRAIKGEGRNDAEALNAVRSQLTIPLSTPAGVGAGDHIPLREGLIDCLKKIGVDE